MSDVTAMADIKSNSIIFPAAILQRLTFERTRPASLNYGAIGFIIGHEITHHFDEEGRRFNSDGELHDDGTWWDENSIKNYKKQAQCLIAQYNNFTIEQIQQRINGIASLGENIANNGGMKIAYRAYRNLADKYGEGDSLPGINYTPDQLFWISSANFICWKSTPQRLKLWANSASSYPKFM